MCPTYFSEGIFPESSRTHALTNACWLLRVFLIRRARTKKISRGTRRLRRYLKFPAKIGQQFQTKFEYQLIVTWAWKILASDGGKWQVHCLEEEIKDVMNTVDSILWAYDLIQKWGLRHEYLLRSFVSAVSAVSAVSVYCSKKDLMILLAIESL